LCRRAPRARYEVVSSAAERDYPLRYMLWGNIEVGTERWWNGGFAKRTFIGYARGCTMTSCRHADGGQGIPYAGLGFGYAF
jgi:hypothetical protein